MSKKKKSSDQTARKRSSHQPSGYSDPYDDGDEGQVDLSPDLDGYDDDDDDDGDGDDDGYSFDDDDDDLGDERAAGSDFDRWRQDLTRSPQGGSRSRSGSSRGMLRRSGFGGFAGSDDDDDL